MDVCTQTSDWLFEPPGFAVAAVFKGFAPCQHGALLQRSPAGSRCIIPCKNFLADDLFILNILVLGQGTGDQLRPKP